MEANTKGLDQCPLCYCSHRAYVYSKAHSRVVYCTNCGLLEDIDFTTLNEDLFQYSPKAKSLVEALISQSSEKITLVTTIRGNKSLQPLIEKLCSADRIKVIDFESLATFSISTGSIIVDDHLLDQINPLAILNQLREQMNDSQDIVFLIELVGGNHHWLRGIVGITRITRKILARLEYNFTNYSLHQILRKSGLKTQRTTKMEQI